MTDLALMLLLATLQPRVVCYPPTARLLTTAEELHDPVPRPTCWRGTRYLGHPNGDGTYDNE